MRIGFVTSVDGHISRKVLQFEQILVTVLIA